MNAKSAPGVEPAVTSRTNVAPVTPAGTRHWPIEIRLKSAEKALEIDFDDGRRFRYSAEFWRVMSGGDALTASR